MNKTSDVLSGERIVFMDRARLMLVVLVVFMHSACAYSNIIPWWSVQEFPKITILDIFIMFADGFQMPVLFFISGFFAYYSIKKRSWSEFIISKFRRLGWPFPAVALFLTPYISYTGVQRIMKDAPGFFNFWLFQLKTTTDFTPVFFSTIETAKKHWMDYSSWHLWFVLLLFVFYLIYAAFDFLKEKCIPANSEKSNGNIINVFIIAGLLMAFFYSVIYLYIIDWPWFKISIFSFQPVRLPLYICLFMLGIYSASQKWVENKKSPGRIWMWGISFFVFSGFVVFCMSYMFANWFQPRTYFFSLFHGFVRTGAIISATGFLFKLASPQQNKNRLIDGAGAYTYEIYIIHLPLVILFAKLFTFITLPLILKFVLTGTTVTFLSLALGRFLIKPYPKTACAVIAGVFALLCHIYR